jgi:hypothetical protein
MFYLIINRQNFEKNIIFPLFCEILSLQIIRDRDVCSFVSVFSSVDKDAGTDKNICLLSHIIQGVS